MENDSIDANEEGEDDLDQLLDEFRQQDMTKTNKSDYPKYKTESHDDNDYDFITAGLDSRDFDMNNSMKMSIQGSSSSSSTTTSNTRKQRRRNQTSIFGFHNNQGTKPPHFIAGGLGMRTLRDDDDAVVANNQSSMDADEQRSIPWPYSSFVNDSSSAAAAAAEMPATGTSQDHWFTFIAADTYMADLSLLETIINSGDPNALCMFVSDKPYVPEALLKLYSVLYNTNQKEAALSLLRRALWVFECAAQPSFFHLDGAPQLMDYKGGAINQHFFSALFQLSRISRVHGVLSCSLAISKLLLSLDPLRDPMGILLTIDYAVIACGDTNALSWFIELMESDKILLYSDDDENNNINTAEGQDQQPGTLLHMPNLAYSYALALFRMSRQMAGDESQQYLDKSQRMLQSAIRQYPAVLPQLLERNSMIKSAITGYSLSSNMQWSEILQKSSSLWLKFTSHIRRNARENFAQQENALDAIDFITQVFVENNQDVWNSDEFIVPWLHYAASEALRSQEQDQEQDEQQHANQSDSASSRKTESICLALARYKGMEMTDFKRNVQMLPEDVNILDPMLVGYATSIDPNRPQLLRRMRQYGGGGGGNGIHDGDGGALGMGNAPYAMLELGLPIDRIDPDSPLMEIFLRSALPWARVNGV
mmetsp:Transcript_18345/g.52380  ORF Transcript_18345/g.52380 Transcript_18345/m.52380 type:complete len:650 (+) Transcript_18345:173-2122(+)